MLVAPALAVVVFVAVHSEVAFWVPVAVRPRLAEIEMRWRDPFGDALGVFPRCPALLLEQPVIGPAGEGQRVDVGAVVRGPFIDVVNLGQVSGRGTAGTGTATILGVQHNSLSGCGDAFGLTQIQLAAG